MKIIIIMTILFHFYQFSDYVGDYGANFISLNML